ncbi:MAG: nitrogenase component 1 [Halanaerobiales bacterium]|nr:nitrogenase component 1 [Halanaerobiales bacterium]
MYISTKKQRIEPLKGCSMVGIIEGILGIEDALPVVHGPLSCSSGHRMVYLFADKEPILPTTALTEQDLILGSQDKLKYALDKAYKIYKPKYLVIIITCAISMSGEEFNVIINKFEKNNDCKVSVLDGSGLYGEEPDGFNLLYDDIIKRFNVNDTNSNVISLDGIALSDVNARKNYNTLLDMIKKYTNLKTGPSIFMDFNLENDLDNYLNTQKIKIGHLWNKYDIENNRPAPYGVKGTFSWLKWIEEITGEKISNNLIKDYNKYNKKLSTIKENINFEKVKVVIEGDSWSSLGLASFIQNELNAKVFLSTDNYGVQYNKNNKLVNEIYNDMGGYELFKKANEINPDLVFGSSYIRCKKKWDIIPFSQPVYHLYEKDHNLLGFEGVFNIVDLIKKSIKNK